MLKRLIFDLDNTLIEWKDEYNKVVAEALEDINYPYTPEIIEKINQKEDEYEKTVLTYTKQGLLEFLNKELNLNLTIDFINGWIKRVPYCIPQKMNKEDYQTLEYLSKKYEMVVLSNYLTTPQKARLENLGILKFFKEVYGGDKFTKPHKESFLNAAGNYSIDECAMIGDDINADIKGAQNAGIKKIIYKNNNDKAKKYKDFLNNIDIINNLNELKEIF